MNAIFRIIMAVFIGCSIFAAVPLMRGTFRTVEACNPGRTSSVNRYTAGMTWYGGGLVVGGVYAQIENVDVYVYPGAVGTTAWVMLTDTSPSRRYAQLGWIDKSDGSRNTMLQVRNSYSDVTTRTTDQPKRLGSYPYYTVLFDPSTYLVTFQLDGMSWPWRGYSVATSWLPTRVDIVDEIQNRASQMPGATTDAMGFFDAHRWTNGAWQNLGGTGGSSNSTEWPYDGPYYSGTQVYIWDSKCSYNG